MAWKQRGFAWSYNNPTYNWWLPGPPPEDPHDPNLNRLTSHGSQPTGGGFLANPEVYQNP